MDKRRALRVAVEHTASFKGKTGLHQGTVFNLSASGCALESGEPIDPDTTIQLDLLIPNDKNPVKVSQARVTWKAGSDMGVQFLNMNETARVRLQQYIERVAGKTSKKKKA